MCLFVRKHLDLLFALRAALDCYRQPYQYCFLSVIALPLLLDVVRLRPWQKGLFLPPSVVRKCSFTIE